jgi:antitoxin HicB
LAEEYRLHLQVKRVENGQYLATSDGFPGLVAQGRTRAEAAEIAQDVAKKLLESYREHGDTLPDGLQTMDTEVVELDIAIGI